MDHERTDWKPSAVNEMDIKIWEQEMQDHLLFDTEEGFSLLMEWEIGD